MAKKKSNEEKEAEELAKKAKERQRKKRKGQGDVSSEDLPGDGLAKGAGSAIERRQAKRRSLLDM